MELFRVLLTATGSVVALFVITKLLGHKQVAQLDFFDYVNGITIGSIGAEMAIATEELWRPLLALFVYGLASLLLTLLARKLPRLRKYINGTPTILFSDGILYRENLKKAKLELSEFLLLCREQGYFDLTEIAVAIFETNGKLSILPQNAHRPTTPLDLGLPTAEAHIGTELVMDGRVLGENLARIGKSEAWLSNLLVARGYSSPREVLLAVWREKDERLTVFPIKVPEKNFSP